MDVPDTYYRRNRERLLAQAKEYYQEHREHYQQYNRDYYKKRIGMDTLREPKPAPDPKPQKQPKPPKEKKKRCYPPKDYFHYEKDQQEPIVNILPSYTPKPHQLKKIKEICPLGFLESKNDNPFVLHFK